MTKAFYGVQIQKIFVGLALEMGSRHVHLIFYQDGSRQAMGSISLKGAMAGAPFTLKRKFFL